jgi:molybdopterin/thiamine biosynthesis adenylyltransferase
MPRSRRHTERYSRQIDISGWGAEGQKRLGSSHVFVAGVGGLGCAAATYLAAAGVGKLTICDSDLVELSNLNRQVLYSTLDVGSPKAPLAAARLRALNPDIEIVPDMTEIDHANAAGVIEGATLVLDCLDNLETRVALNRAAIAMRVPMIYAACSELTGHLSFLHPPATPCLECFVSRMPPAVEPAIPGVTPGAIGALEAMEAVKYLTGVGEPLAGRLLILEGTEPRVDVIEIERDPDCPACRGLS